MSLPNKRDLQNSDEKQSLIYSRFTKTTTDPSKEKNSSPYKIAYLKLTQSDSDLPSNTLFLSEAIYQTTQEINSSLKHFSNNLLLNIVRLKHLLNDLFYGEYEKKIQAFNDVISFYSPQEILDKIFDYKDKHDYDERLTYATEIFSQMEEKGEECFNALSNLFKNKIRQKNYWVIRRFLNNICEFDFEKNQHMKSQQKIEQLNKKRIELLKSIYNNYSPKDQSNYSKEQLKQDFKKDIQDYLNNCNTPLKNSF